MPTSYDVLIIGSGQAGNPLATAFAEAGRTVALVEENHLGGSCINYGCSPTKALLAAAERAHQIRTAADYGIRSSAPEVDFPAVIARKNAIIQRSRTGVRENLTKEHEGITVLHGHAAFTAPRTLQVKLADNTAQELTAPLIFINTGTRAAVPDLPGLADVPYLTTTELLNLQELPEHLLILGGGYIGLEFGQMFRRFGSKVTIIESGAHLLEHEDADVCGAMEEMLTAEGIEFVLGAQAHHVSQNAEGVVTLSARTREGERRLRGTHLLIATGRVPNSDKLGLDVIGVKSDEKGYIQVNNRLETAAKGVYALGDVHGGPQFTHISYDDYRVVRDGLLHRKWRSARQRPLPYTVFTDPQLGRIGLNEDQAREQGIRYRVGKMPVRTIGRARETGRILGFWKVLVDAQDRVIGAAILGAEGGEIMTMFQLIMMGKLKYQQLQNMVIAHPTWAEGLNNVFSKLEEPTV
ncbi:mercuric reductase [Hymenobacter cellulosivorans]|uniref:Mercuric reductase n=1 Tax=Hymenobacter cellulosivorans TaxID=2932249 RepID=A0ABY4FE52_9BACT|nr:mercuric reductase [Hymenobacter cellulosivorans]UOQ54951.1 mercuric reductase [Hymenobacter cellulosivorans]